MAILGLLVIAHPIGVGRTRNDRIAREENSTEQSGADLAHASADARDRTPIGNDQGFLETVFEADIAKRSRHRKSLARRNQQSMELGCCRLDVLDAFRAGAAKISGRMIGIADQAGNAQRLGGGIISHRRLDVDHLQGDIMLALQGFLLDGREGGTHVQFTPDDR